MSSASSADASAGLNDGDDVNDAAAAAASP